MKITLYKKMRSSSRLHRWKWQPFPAYDIHPEWYHLPNFIAFTKATFGGGEYQVKTSVRKGRKAILKTIAKFRCEAGRRYIVHDDGWNALLAT